MFDVCVIGPVVWDRKFYENLERTPQPGVSSQFTLTMLQYVIELGCDFFLDGATQVIIWCKKYSAPLGVAAIE